MQHHYIIRAIILICWGPGPNGYTSSRYYRIQINGYQRIFQELRAERINEFRFEPGKTCLENKSFLAHDLEYENLAASHGCRHSFRAGPGESGRLREIGGTKGNGGSIMGVAIPGASGTSISASRLTCSVPEVTGAAIPVMDRPEPKGPPVSFGPPQTPGRV